MFHAGFTSKDIMKCLTPIWHQNPKQPEESGSESAPS